MDELRKYNLKQNSAVEKWTCYVRPFIKREKAARSKHYVFGSKHTSGKSILVPRMTLMDDHNHRRYIDK